jgi:hypothetical protein
MAYPAARQVTQQAFAIMCNTGRTMTVGSIIIGRRVGTA